MNGATNTIENERLAMLNEARKAIAGSPVAKVELALSFGKKISRHWLILATAVIFDLLAMIPFLCIVINFIFGLVLFLYFGPKTKTSGSEFVKIALPVAGGSVIDFFMSVFPVNIGTALIRIALSDEQ